MSSVKSFWFFAQGISKSIYAPVGTKAEIETHVEWVETILQIKREKYLDNPEQWTATKYVGIADETLCAVAIEHNRWQRKLFEDFEKWAENQSGEGLEEITPDYAVTFFPALTEIIVPVNRWSRQYYIDRMEVYYEAMRGREAEGIRLAGKPLTIAQANAVIWLFSHVLDEHDTRLEVPKGHDSLYASDDGGYEWCEKCGPVAWEDAQYCKKRKCPFR